VWPFKAKVRPVDPPYWSDAVVSNNGRVVVEGKPEQVRETLMKNAIGWRNYSVIRGEDFKVLGVQKYLGREIDIKHLSHVGTKN
jgi:hypothetical protein